MRPPTAKALPTLEAPPPAPQANGGIPLQIAGIRDPITQKYEDP